MRAEYIQQEFIKADVFSDIDPKEVAKEAKLSLIKRLLFVIAWPYVKPILEQKLGEKFAKIIEQLLSGI